MRRAPGAFSAYSHYAAANFRKKYDELCHFIEHRRGRLSSRFSERLCQYRVRSFLRRFHLRKNEFSRNPRVRGRGKKYEKSAILNNKCTEVYR